MGKRERDVLLFMSSWCLVIVVWLFLTVPRVCVQFVIVVFPDHTHFLCLEQTFRKSRHYLVETDHKYEWTDITQEQKGEHLTDQCRFSKSIDVLSYSFGTVLTIIPFFVYEKLLSLGGNRAIVHYITCIYYQFSSVSVIINTRCYEESYEPRKNTINQSDQGLHCEVNV